MSIKLKNNPVYIGFVRALSFTPLLLLLTMMLVAPLKIMHLKYAPSTAEVTFWFWLGVILGIVMGAIAYVRMRDWNTVFFSFFYSVFGMMIAWFFVWHYLT